MCPNLKLKIPTYCQKCVNSDDKSVQYVVLSNGDKKAKHRFLKLMAFPRVMLLSIE